MVRSMQSVRLKSGCNLASAVSDDRCFNGDHLLVLMKSMTVELLALSWDINPQATLATDGAGSLDGKADDVGRISGRRKIDVTARDIRMTSIVQREVVDLSGL